MTPFDRTAIMDGFAAYQDEARKTAIYPERANVAYPLIGLVGEVGEFANKFKKTIRDQIILDKEDAKKELGDILWYLSSICCDLNIAFDEVALMNLEKLNDRAQRGVIGGSGDSR